MGITAGIYRVRSAVPECRSFASVAEKFPRDTEHSGHRQLQLAEQRVDEIVRRAEGAVRPSRHHNHGRAGADGWNERRGGWVRGRGGAVVARVAGVEKHRHVGDELCRVTGASCSSELRSVAGFSRGARHDVSGALCAHSLAVRCRRTAATVCSAAAGSVCPGCGFVDAVLCRTGQQQQQ